MPSLKLFAGFLAIVLTCSQPSFAQEVVSIEELKVQDDLFYRGKKKYSGFVTGVKTQENRFSSPFANYVVVPFQSRYPLDKLNLIDSIYASILKGQLQWVKTFKIKKRHLKEPFALIEHRPDGSVSYGFYGNYVDGKLKKDTANFSKEFTAVNDTLNGIARTRDYNHGKKIYEKRDIFYMKDGVSDGVHYWYYPINEDGIQFLKLRGMNKAGKRNGIDSTWYENGKLESVYQFKDNEMVNYSLMFYKDGKSIKDSSVYDENGEEIAYYKYTFNGKLYAKKENGEFSNEKLSGEVITENTEGRLVYRTVNDAHPSAYDGKIEIKDYDGNLLEVWHFENGRKNGMHIRYSISGEVLLQEEYDDGSLIQKN